MKAQLIILWTLVLAPSAAGFVVVLRSLPIIERKMWDRKKPWACDLCMSFWCTLLAGCVIARASGDRVALLACAPSLALCMLLLRALTSPRGAPPPMPRTLPELQEDDS